LGLLLLDILNEEAEPGTTWRIYHKEILDRLARETNLATIILERQRSSKPRLLVDFFRSLSGEKVPSGYEIRNRITTIIRGLAIEGHAVIVGQGGAGATADLPNGLSIRLEAPEEWRVKQIAFREGVSEAQARTRMHAKEVEREYLRKIYEARFPRKPSFNLTYDCSAFTLAQIAQHVVYMMKLRGCI
jgi:cytidylate kinase